ncbi:ABC transporter ATP-binding protein [Lactococcus protaetiae]|uniref:ABC transporter ATP-binding protein n=1 Tax=Lactococcus protaetiae TaxID=2592653 RepID=A0A514Z6K1_9LACT|nr:ABC transporter ATP-binding protein [Lactococcus protaetiae]MCL2114027.1 ABC transporter ATP-binding protein [Streptococcaceae bacterium]QDK70221.1 ABC transporter ATP-binding protein [Lactococcus protaetiae]
MENAVSVKNLTVKFDKIPVLNQLSLELKKGEIVGLIGPSGAGKSTFINALLGMVKPNVGEIKIFGKEIPNRQIMAKIGFMAQSDALFTELTGRQNLEFFGSLQGIAKKDLAEKMIKSAQIVNLTADLDKRISGYSGGMKRRLSLAIALTADAPLILLDEPTVGIDPELRRDIWDELREQAAKGKAILVTTHVMDEAERCNQVLLLRDGKFVAQGTPVELKTQYDATSIEEVFIKAGQELEHSKNMGVDK